MSLPRVYLLLGFFAGYALLMLFNPVRLSMRDGFRCVARFKRIGLTFVLLGFAYFGFPIRHVHADSKYGDVDLGQIISLRGAGTGQDLSKSGTTRRCRRLKEWLESSITRRRPIRCRSSQRFCCFRTGAACMACSSGAAQTLSLLELPHLSDPFIGRFGSHF